MLKLLWFLSIRCSVHRQAWRFIICAKYKKVPAPCIVQANCFELCQWLLLFNLLSSKCAAIAALLYFRLAWLRATQKCIPIPLHGYCAARIPKLYVHNSSTSLMLFSRRKTISQMQRTSKIPVWLQWRIQDWYSVIATMPHTSRPLARSILQWSYQITMSNGLPLSMILMSCFPLVMVCEGPVY